MSNANTTRRAVWFYSLELASLTDKTYHLSVTATTFDEEEPQLLCQQLLDEHGGTIDDVLAKIRQVLTDAA
jgi:hypothetical protein